MNNPDKGSNAGVGTGNKWMAFAWILVTLCTGLLPSFRDIDYKDFAPLLGFFLLLTLWTLTGLKERVLRWSALEIFLFLYMAWACLSVAWSSMPTAGQDFLGRFLPWIGLYLLARQDPNSRKAASLGWSWAYVLVCLYGLAQQFLWGFIPHLPGGQPDRIYSLFGNPNVFAAFLVLSWPVLLVKPMGWNNQNREVWFRIAVGVLALANLILTGSRAGLLALVAQFVLLVVLMGMKPYQDRRVRWAVALVTLVVLAGVVFFGARLGNRPTERLEVWKGAAQMAMQKPILGWGINQFSMGFPDFMSGRLNQEMQKDNTFAEHVHNEFLELWVELGLVGLFLASLFWLRVAGKPLAALWAGRDGEETQDFASMGLFLGIVGAGFTNLFDYNCRLTGVGSFLWLATAWLVNVFESGKTFRFSENSGKIFTAGLLTLSLFGFVFSIPAVLSRLSAPPSSDFLKDLPTDLPGEKQKLESAISQNPANADLYHRLGNVDAKLNLMDEAEKAYKKEISLNPSAAGAYLNLGNVYFFKADKNPGNLDQAIAYYGQSVVLDPNSIEGHFNLAYALFVKKDMKTALSQLDEVLRLDPHNDRALSLKRQILP